MHISRIIKNAEILKCKLHLEVLYLKHFILDDKVELNIVITLWNHVELTPH